MSVELCDEITTVAETTVRSRLDDALRNQGDAPLPLAAAYLAHRLKELGISVMQLSEDCNVTRQFVYRVLRGEKPLSSSLIRSIASATAMTITELAFVVALQTVEDARNGSA